MKKFTVKEIVQGKKVVVMKGRRGKQTVFHLNKDMSDLDIQKAVIAGVDISHFEESKDGKGQLKSFVVNSKTKERLLDSTSKRTKLVGLSVASKKEIVEPTVTEFEIKFKLGEVFNDFEKAVQVFDASEEQLEEMDLKEINKVTKLRGGLSAERIYKALHPED